LQTAQSVSAVIKVKKIASRSFKGKGVQSGFRLVYAYFEEEERIVLIELYHKSKQANEDRERIKAFLANHK
jgi:mRNA-degrading endonuclease RelE of RelBE toxin-antitoxin system